jgi:nitrile hydratase subunit beta
MPRIHDMGGNREFYGPIDKDEAVFHADWERRAYVIAILSHLNLGGRIDVFRRAIEELPRETYLRNYYARWLATAERLLVDQGYLGRDEVDARIAGRDAPPGARRPPRLQIAVMRGALRVLVMRQPPFALRLYARFMGYGRRTGSSPRFEVGDRVKTVGEKPPGHTRLPGYAVGHEGTVVAHHGAMVFPDANADGRGEDPQHCYTVEFDAAELWQDAEPHTSVRIDLFEPYLESP